MRYLSLVIYRFCLKRQLCLYVLVKQVNIRVRIRVFVTVGVDFFSVDIGSRLLYVCVSVCVIS